MEQNTDKFVLTDRISYLQGRDNSGKFLGNRKIVLCEFVSN